MINNILDTIKYLLVGVGICWIAIVISDKIYNWSPPTKVETSQSWCQNKPDGVVMETYHSKVYHDEARPYYFQETCYKKTMKDAVAFSEDTLGWIIRADCHYDPTCFHNIQRIYVK